MLSDGAFLLGEWMVEPRLNRLTRDGKSIQIELKMMDVLVCLAEHAGELVERQQLIDTVWATEFVAENILTRAIAELRDALGDDAKNPTYIETIHRRGYRLLIEPEPAEGLQHGRRRWIRRVFIAIAITFLAIAGSLWLLSERPVLAEIDTLVLTDFVNRTGDPIFDDTLKQALAIKLEESPLLDVISEQSVRKTLRLMDRDPDEAVTPALGREVCQRLNLKAMIAGEIAPLGSHYVVTLNTVECSSGESLARDQVEAAAQEDVLAAIDRATADLRRKLGESLRSIKEFDTPLVDGATPSLEALKSYSIAARLLRRGQPREAVLHARRAIELDPEFANAYGLLAAISWNKGDREEAKRWITEAYSVRNRATEHHRLVIEAFYFRYATGELHKALDAYILYRDLYPRKIRSVNSVANVYQALGQFETALDLRLEYFGLRPDGVFDYSNLARDYLALNRVEEAKQILSAGFAKGIDREPMRVQLYRIAFLEGDLTTTEEQIQWSSGEPDEGRMLREHALAAAFGGRFRDCRDLARRSHEVAEHHDSWARHSSTLASIALAEAHSGQLESAVTDAEAAVVIARHPTISAIAARALASTGEIERAREIADELARSWPLDTLLKSTHVPAIRAEIALAMGNPERTIELLRTSHPYEKRWCYVIDIRGRAYLASGSPVEAATEFEKLLDLRGVSPVNPRYATAHLWLGRSHAAAGNIQTALKSYQTFLDLWKDADPDIPLLLEARVEYEQLIEPGQAAP